MQNKTAQKTSFLNIFKVFLKIGMILLGGGYVIMPIMKNELVEKRKWLDDENLCNFYCVSQCLPGIIAINMSILTGYALKGMPGALGAILGISFSPVIVIIIIAHILSNIVQIPFIDGLFFGINLSVIVLIYLTVKEIWSKSICDYISALWFLLILALALFKVNPAFLIMLSVLFGILYAFIRKDKN